MKIEACSILIVDDDIILSEILKKYLENNQYKVDIVNSGLEAVEYCKTCTPNLVILDLVMPEIDGIETCKRLKLIPSFKRTPVIMLTGHNESQTIIDSFDAGAIDFITKPVDKLLLLKRIETALQTIKLNTNLVTKQRELLRSQLHARIAIIKINIQKNEIEISTSCYKMFDFYSFLSTYSFDVFLNHIHPDDRQLVSKKLNDSILMKEDSDIEYRFITNANVEYVFHQQCEYLHNIDTNDSYLFGSFRDVTEEKTLQNTIKNIKHIDYLTSLPNRSYFENIIKNIIDTPPTDTLFSVVFIGLDNFTRVNDEFGHNGGDIVLQVIADRLKSLEINTNVLSRFSGDVFSLTLANLMHIDECNESLERILTIIKEPIQYKNNEIFITASIGASVFPLEGDTVEQLLIGAESAMMLSQEEGGNRYTYRTHDMNLQTRKKLKLLKEIRTALDKDQFIVFYQPQVDASTMEIVGMEALVRWLHPDEGIIYPDDFIPIAEESGLIMQLGNFVLKEACLQTKRWLDQGYDLTIGVNVSSQQFEEENFIDNVINTLRETSLPAQNLEIEITESMSMINHEYTIDILNTLRGLNIKTSMDDFGTGYSSLSQLQTLPLDILKVDQAFVRCILSEKNSNDNTDTYKNCAIANAIIVMAHTLGLKVIAEGVETQDQCTFLKGQSSEILQGYLFSKPIPKDEFEKLLSNSGFIQNFG